MRYQKFYRSALYGGEFHVTLRDAANTSLSILKIMESAENGKPVLVGRLY